MSQSKIDRSIRLLTYIKAFGKGHGISEYGMSPERKEVVRKIEDAGDWARRSIKSGDHSYYMVITTARGEGKTHEPAFGFYVKKAIIRQNGRSRPMHLDNTFVKFYTPVAWSLDQNIEKHPGEFLQMQATEVRPTIAKFLNKDPAGIVCAYLFLYHGDTEVSDYGRIYS